MTGCNFWGTKFLLVFLLCYAFTDWVYVYILKININVNQSMNVEDDWHM